MSILRSDRNLFQPDVTDDDEPMFFDGPLFEPTEDDLAWLLSQEPACRGLPETLAELRKDIESVRRSLVTSEVADFLARSRQGHDA